MSSSVNQEIDCEAGGGSGGDLAPDDLAEAEAEADRLDVDLTDALPAVTVGVVPSSTDVMRAMSCSREGGCCCMPPLVADWLTR